MMRSKNSGQATMEYVLLCAGVVFPLTFAIIYTAELLWVWHSVVEFTRDGAQYATTHCWQSGADNVRSYMTQHVPAMIDASQIVDSDAIEIQYYSKDPTSGQLGSFDDGCSSMCVPDVVTVRVKNYQFRYFMGYVGLPPVTIPEFFATLPMESAGYNGDSADSVGTCNTDTP